MTYTVTITQTLPSEDTPDIATWLRTQPEGPDGLLKNYPTEVSSKSLLDVLDDHRHDRSALPGFISLTTNTVGLVTTFITVWESADAASLGSSKFNFQSSGPAEPMRNQFGSVLTDESGNTLYYYTPGAFLNAAWQVQNNVTVTSTTVTT